MSVVYNHHPGGSRNFVKLTANIDLILHKCQVCVIIVGPFSTLMQFVNWILLQKADKVPFCVECLMQIKQFCRK